MSKDSDGNNETSFTADNIMDTIGEEIRSEMSTADKNIVYYVAGSIAKS